MKFFKYLFILLAFTYTLPNAAQMSRQKERVLMLKVVDLLDDYEHYSMIDSHTKEYSSTDHFLDLFMPDALVYNDLIALSPQEYFTPSEYAQLLETSSMTTIVELRDIDKEKVEYDGTTWKIRCRFKKYINFTTQCGIELSTDFAYGEQYSMVATIVYDEESDQCFFERIDGSMAAQRSFPDDYIVLKKKNPDDEKIMYDGKTLKFNPMGQAFLPVGGKYKAADPEMVVRAIAGADCRQHSAEIKGIKQNPTTTPDCKLYSLQYKKPHVRFRPHIDITMGDFYKLTSSSNDLSVSQSTNEMGLDFGFLLGGKRVKTSFNIGVLYQKSTFNLELGEHEFYYETTGNADIDNDPYRRCYRINNGRENFDFSYLGVPVYFDFDICIGAYFSLYLQAGVKPYLNIASNYNDFSMDSYAYGEYTAAYGNLILNENWTDKTGKPYNNFGSSTITAANVVNQELPINSFIMDGFGGGGLRIKIPSIHLEFEFGASYRIPVMQVYKSMEGVPSLSGNVSGYNAPLTYTIASGEKAHTLNSLLTDIKRNNLQLTMGLIFKL